MEVFRTLVQLDNAGPRPHTLSDFLPSQATPGTSQQLTLSYLAPNSSPKPKLESKPPSRQHPLITH